MINFNIQGFFFFNFQFWYSNLGLYLWDFVIQKTLWNHPFGPSSALAYFYGQQVKVPNLSYLLIGVLFVFIS